MHYRVGTVLQYSLVNTDTDKAIYRLIRTHSEGAVVLVFTRVCCEYSVNCGKDNRDKLILL